ncbi:MAG: FAD-dependent oxidoreductase [Anaerolineales bacterium]
MDSNQAQHAVAIVGAGPAGLFAAKHLSGQSVRVALLNRDVRPGGLAEYGIYPDKLRMKDGLRKQFQGILSSPLVDYFGHVAVGARGNLALQDLLNLGFEAILVTVGAQGTKWLGLPGENLQGVYHAKDLVYHYNRLPPFSQRQYEIGRRVAVIGMGNVMTDICYWLVREQKVEEIAIVARRGPAEVKFDKKEFERLAANLDAEALEREVARVAPSMRAIGQNPAAARDFILSGRIKALPSGSSSRLRFEFLSAPTRLLGDERDRVHALEVEDTTLVPAVGGTSALGRGTRREISVDTVIFAIGDCVDPGFGLPVQGTSFVKNPQPRFPIEGVSYEVWDPSGQRPWEAIFLAGWAREASTGLVGVARKDGTNGAKAVFQSLRPLRPRAPAPPDQLARRILTWAHPVVTKQDLPRLAAAEQVEAAHRGLAEFRFATDEEMLAAMSLATT